MLHQFIRPMAEYSLHLTTWAPELQEDILFYNRHAVEFVLCHTTRTDTDRVQAIFRLQVANTAGDGSPRITA
jgi:hypothetical protein